MSFHKRTLSVLLLVSLLLCRTAASGADDKDKDKAECTEQLVGLATCLPYVGGTAKSPTPDCCGGLKKVLDTDKKCLCVVINDRNDPDLGLMINVTLALGLPTVCRVPANVSKCPELLHLAPNSADAKVFYQYAHNSGDKSATSPAPTVSANATSRTRTTQPTSDGNVVVNRWSTLEVIGTIIVSIFTSNFVI